MPGKRKERAEVLHTIPDPWEDRIVRSERVPLDTLLFNPANWRVHPRDQQEAIAASLESLGWLRRILVNTTTGNMIDGHQRVLEADKAGQATVPVDFVTLTIEEEEQALATLDAMTSMAVRDQVKLDALMDRLRSNTERPLDPRTHALLDSLRGKQTEARERLVQFTASDEPAHGVVVLCPTDTEARALLDQLQDEGYDCRLLDKRERNSV